MVVSKEVFGAVRAVSTKMRRRTLNLFTSRKQAKFVRSERRARACWVKMRFPGVVELARSARTCGDESAVCRASRDCFVIRAFANSRHIADRHRCPRRPEANLRHLQRILPQHSTLTDCSKPNVAVEVSETLPR